MAQTIWRYLLPKMKMKALTIYTQSLINEYVYVVLMSLSFLDRAFKFHEITLTQAFYMTILYSNFIIRGMVDFCLL